MFDPRDLYALPNAFSLTLWDAIPVYLSVGLALAILMRTIFSEQALHTAWRLREVSSVEGLLYLAAFQPPLLPVLLLAAIIMSAVRERQTVHVVPPSTPGMALKTRFGELVGALLLPCLAAAIIKVFAPSIPDNLAIHMALALGGSILVGGRSGASAIPAVAIAVHLGGFIPATVWIAGAAARVVFTTPRHRASQTPAMPT